MVLDVPVLADELVVEELRQDGGLAGPAGPHHQHSELKPFPSAQIST